jgi:type VI protein secretion system component VasK
MPKTLVNRLRTLLPDIQLSAGEGFYWSPGQQLITYQSKALASTDGQWALIHEAAHAKLGHQTYHSDYQLLMMEVAAWRQAQKLAADLGLTIDPEHVQDCLDTYRDWLHQRSTCPSCSTVSLQINVSTYRCHNCHTSWHVSTSRFCRPYRLRQTNLKQKSSEISSQTTFA